MNDDLFRHIIERLLDNAADALKEKKQSSDEFYDGKALAYYEVLDTIKNDLYIGDLDPEEFGLGMDLDKKVSVTEQLKSKHRNHV